MDWLSSQELLAIGSAILGAAASSIVGFWLALAQAIRARASTEERKFEEAIQSDDLQVLGGYLHDNLGQVEMSAYLNDDTSRRRVNRYVKRISDLVQLPSDVPETQKPELAQEAPAVGTQQVEEPTLDLIGLPSDPPPLRESLESLRRGETWTALASLRRDLEKRLLEVSPAPPDRKGPPYSYIFDVMTREFAKRFWYIASRAVHGEEVSSEEAALAVDLARHLYKYLETRESSKAQVHP